MLRMTSPRTTLLAVGLEYADRRLLARAAAKAGCMISLASTIASARMLQAGRIAPIIFCERDLPDGTWKDLLDFGRNVIVVSRVADESFWADVLNRGGHDALASPLEERDVLHALGSACRDARCLEATSGEKWATAS